MLPLKRDSGLNHTNVASVKLLTHTHRLWVKQMLLQTFHASKANNSERLMKCFTTPYYQKMGKIWKQFNTPRAVANEKWIFVLIVKKTSSTVLVWDQVMNVKVTSVGKYETIDCTFWFTVDFSPGLFMSQLGTDMFHQSLGHKLCLFIRDSLHFCCKLLQQKETLLGRNEEEEWAV